MDPMLVFLQTSMLWISIGLPVVFAILTFTLSASFFRFIASGTFAIGAWYILTQSILGGIGYQVIGVLYIGLAIAMPFAKITSKNEDSADKPEDTALSRYEQRMKTTQDRVSRLRRLGGRKTVVKNPYTGDDDE